MKKHTKPTDESAHQTVAEFINLKTPEETIQIGFTDQKVSGRARMLTFASFLPWHRMDELLGKVMPPFKKRKRGFEPGEYATGFVTGVLAGAKKLTHLGRLRSDVTLAPMLGIPGMPSQSAFSRFFQCFTSSGQNLQTFNPLWRWSLERLPSRLGG
jgi:NADPH-dependent curcumin reductase CurA